MFLLNKMNHLFDERLFSIFPLIIILFSIILGKLMGIFFFKTEEKMQLNEHPSTCSTENLSTSFLDADKKKLLLSNLKTSLSGLVLSQSKISQIQLIAVQDIQATTFVHFYHEEKEAFICTGIISNNNTITFSHKIDEQFLTQLQDNLHLNYEESITSELGAVFSILYHHTQLTNENEHTLCEKAKLFFYQTSKESSAQILGSSLASAKDHSFDQYD